MQTRKYEFRGVPFEIACDNIGSYPPDASWFTFEDESDVREADWNVRPGDVVLDVGAAYGSYTMTALTQGASFVWAWSPQAWNPVRKDTDYFRETLRMNGWEDRCTVHDSGLFSSPGWLNTRTQELTPEDPGPGPDVIRVETLDAWSDRARPSRVDWMKIDVEGAEVNILRGGLGLIGAMRPRILVENHLFVRASIQDEIQAILEGIGYSCLHHRPTTYGVSHSAYVHREAGAAGR